MTDGVDYDVAILGAGLAGLSLATRLADPRFSELRVLIVEPRVDYRRDRTWSYWNLRPHPFREAVIASWDKWAVVTEDRHVVRQVPGLRYETIPADAFYRLALARLRAAPNITMLSGVTAAATEDDDGVQIRFGQLSARAAVAFDTRPPMVSRRYGLTQVFVGLEIETRDAVFDPGTTTLMDFRCAQSGATHFTYVLPFTGRRALIEDTWFAPAGFRPPDHKGFIRDYLRIRFGVDDFAILFEERGALPMDPVFRPCKRKRLVAFGSAGAATRPSTGYAFNAIQAECDAVAADLAAGQRPHAAPPRPRMVRLMDKVLLELLGRQPELAPHVFASLFDRCDPLALVRFLNDAARPSDFVAIAAAIPFLPTVRSALRLAAERMEWSGRVVAG